MFPLHYSHYYRVALLTRLIRDTSAVTAEYSTWTPSWAPLPWLSVAAQMGSPGWV